MARYVGYEAEVSAHDLHLENVGFVFAAVTAGASVGPDWPGVYVANAMGEMRDVVVRVKVVLVTNLGKEIVVFEFF